MEDPDECGIEWITDQKGYYYSYYDRDRKEVDDSMVLKIGRCGIGIIGGIAVAPLVVPPLVVASAMGVAVSVPFGFLFATYACTNKLMTMLLPLPQQQQMIKYYLDYETSSDEHGDEQAQVVIRNEESCYVGDGDLVGLAGSKNEEALNQMQDVVVVSDRNDESGFDSREEQELDLVSEVVVEDGEKVSGVSTGTEEELGGDESREGSEDVGLRTMEEDLVYANKDSVEICVDEGGSDLIEERNGNGNLEESVAVNEVVKEHTVDDVNNGGDKDVLAYSPLGRAPLDTNGAEVASRSYKKMSSREENLDDEKIWEIIGAMRAIVGYKAPSQPTCIGELKALYLFTGVEPPASINGDSGLDEATVRLKFLMSIVGVK